MQPCQRILRQLAAKPGNIETMTNYTLYTVYSCAEAGNNPVTTAPTIVLKEGALFCCVEKSKFINLII